jgi:nucleotide-binding universal stress UspA family protein
MMSWQRMVFLPERRALLSLLDSCKGRAATSPQISRAARPAAAIVAAEYAAALNARLHVLHVTQPGVGKKQRDSLKDLEEAVAASVPVMTSVESGSPATQIVRYAERCGAEDAAATIQAR